MLTGSEKLFRLFAAAVCCIAVGCNTSGGKQPDVSPEQTEPYRFQDQPSSGTLIKTEYPNYKFTSSETRPVYVGGYRSSSNQNTVWVVNNFGNRIDAYALRTTNNAYLGADGEYYAPLVVKAPNESGSSGYNFFLGDGNYASSSNFTATIEVVANRSYAIEYSCMGATYDLRTTGYQFEQTLTTAYGSANTQFAIANVHNTAIDPEDLDLLTQNALLAWGDDHATDDNGLGHDPNIVVLFGMRSYTVSESSYGKSVVKSADPTPRIAYSFVFGKRIDDDLTDPQQRIVAKTRVSIHELGHSRGKDEAGDEMGDGLFHSGTYQSVCVMGSVQWDPEKAFHFCEWHKQVLFNISW